MGEKSLVSPTLDPFNANQGVGMFKDFRGRLTQLLLITGMLIAAAPALAQDFLTGNRFFTVAEEPGPPTADDYFERRTPSLNLMRWTEHRQPPPRPQTKYHRQNHFGSWLVRNPQSNCFDTRALVLQRESQKPVTPSSLDPCYVGGGFWYDPYTNQNFTDAATVQIDHLVALKNAYISGAFQWDTKTRCAFTNFMGNRYHLIAVEGRANMQKGDFTPARWLPPNAPFRCSYLSAWLRTKLIWRLVLAEDEAMAIAQQVREFGCKEADFKMPVQELREQRQLIARQVAECPATPVRPRIPPRNGFTEDFE